MAPTVDRVVVSDNPDSGEFHEVTEHIDNKLVVVNAVKLHVWYNSTYYIGAGTADSVNQGDVFYYPNGISGDGSPLVKTVAEIKQGDVTFETGGTLAEGSILGEPIQMAQLPPPTLLEPQHSF